MIGRCMQGIQRLGLRVVFIALLCAAGAPPAHAGALGRVTGHLGFGFAKLFIADAPGGSLSTNVGFDYPIDERWGVGLGFGYHLLGSSIVEDSLSSFVANLDYSVFDISLLANYDPTGLGPLARISAGPVLFHGSAELSSSGGGLLFTDLDVSQYAPGFGLDLTFMSKKPAPVRAGLELSTRVGFIDPDTWTMGAVRLVIHY